MKKLFSIFSAALFAVVLFSLYTVDVSAAEPTTYYVKFDSSNNTWYYQVGSSWDDTVPPPKREIYYMLQDMKDGDYVVVEATEGWCGLEIDFHLGNLTVMPYSTAIITCKSVDECYILHDSTIALNADVEHGWVYDNVAVNFNENVNYLEYVFSDALTSTVYVAGTCYDFIVHNDSTTEVHLWNFTEDLDFRDGALKTAAGSYDINPPSSSPAPVTPSTNTSSSASATTAPSTGSADSEYDDVPKTGESFAFVWLFAAAALCFAGSYSFKKRS